MPEQPCCLTLFPRPVDDSRAFALITYGVQVYDFVSDVNFAIFLYHVYDINVNYKDRQSLRNYYYAGVVFVFVPWMANVSWLFYMRFRKWKSNNIVNGWLRKNTFWLIFLTVVSAGANAALDVVNSRIFGLKAFDMGLSRRAQVEAQKVKIGLVTVCENIPQVIIQLMFSISTKTVAGATLAALISSLISIQLVFGAWIVTRGDKGNDKLFEFVLKYTSPHDKKNQDIRKRYHLRNRIAKRVALHAGWQESTVFIEQIVSFGMSGCKVKFSVLSDLSANVLLNKLLKLTNENRLQEAMKDALRLRKLPAIDYVRIASEDEFEDNDYHAARQSMKSHKVSEMAAISMNKNAIALGVRSFSASASKSGPQFNNNNNNTNQTRGAGNGSVGENNVGADGGDGEDEGLIMIIDGEGEGNGGGTGDLLYGDNDNNNDDNDVDHDQLPGKMIQKQVTDLIEYGQQQKKDQEEQKDNQISDVVVNNVNEKNNVEVKIVDNIEQDDEKRADEQKTAHNESNQLFGQILGDKAVAQELDLNEIVMEMETKGNNNDDNINQHYDNDVKDDIKVGEGENNVQNQPNDGAGAQINSEQKMSVFEQELMDQAVAQKLDEENIVAEMATPNGD